VHVKAQVMTRDDSSGGWVPLGGGGVSVVGVRCTAPPSPHRRHRPATYSIYGCRLNDNSARYSSYSVKDRAGAVLAHPPPLWGYRGAIGIFEWGMGAVIGKILSVLCSNMQLFNRPTCNRQIFIQDTQLHSLFLGEGGSRGQDSAVAVPCPLPTPL